jgi:hypothetical protein
VACSTQLIKSHLVKASCSCDTNGPLMHPYLDHARSLQGRTTRDMTAALMSYNIKGQPDTKGPEAARKTATGARCAHISAGAKSQTETSRKLVRAPPLLFATRCSRVIHLRLHLLDPSALLPFQIHTRNHSGSPFEIAGALTLHTPTHLPPPHQHPHLPPPGLKQARKHNMHVPLLHLSLTTAVPHATLRIPTYP